MCCFLLHMWLKLIISWLSGWLSYIIWMSLPQSVKGPSEQSWGFLDEGMPPAIYSLLLPASEGQPALPHSLPDRCGTCPAGAHRHVSYAIPHAIALIIHPEKSPARVHLWTNKFREKQVKLFRLRNWKHDYKKSINQRWIAEWTELKVNLFCWKSEQNDSPGM